MHTWPNWCVRYTQRSDWESFICKNLKSAIFHRIFLFLVTLHKNVHNRYKIGKYYVRYQQNKHSHNIPRTSRTQNVSTHRHADAALMIVDGLWPMAVCGSEFMSTPSPCCLVFADLTGEFGFSRQLFPLRNVWSLSLAKELFGTEKKKNNLWESNTRDVITIHILTRNIT